MAEARNRAHGEALATKIRAENQQFQMDQQARQEQAVNQRMQMSDYLGGKRDERNFSQQKELQGLSQTFAKQQAEAGRAASLAENDRKRAEDAAQAAALAQAGGLPVEASMPEGVQGPGQMIDYGKVGTQGVGQLIGDRRMRDQNAAKVNENQIDNQRADARLEMDRKRVEALAARTGGRLTPEGRSEAIQNMVAEYGLSPEQAERRLSLVETKLMATSQVMPDQTGVKAESRLAEGAVRELRQQRTRLETNAEARAVYADNFGIAENEVDQHITNRINAAAASMRKQPAAPTQAPAAARQYPADVVTEQDRAEYDALLAEQGAGR